VGNHYALITPLVRHRFIFGFVIDGKYTRMFCLIRAIQTHLKMQAEGLPLSQEINDTIVKLIKRKTHE